MSRFDDRVAIVTGAGSGTGAAIATQLVEEGASVVCTDLDGADQTAALLGERSRAVRLDVADAGSVASLMAEVRETHGRLDALFNCAGVDGMVRPLTELSEENLELVGSTTDLARLAGTQKDDTARVLHWLENEGVISLKRGRIIVRSPAALRGHLG